MLALAGLGGLQGCSSSHVAASRAADVANDAGPDAQAAEGPDAIAGGGVAEAGALPDAESVEASTLPIDAAPAPCATGSDCAPLRADFFVIEQLSVCLSGNPCQSDGGMPTCINVYDGASNVTSSFNNDSAFHAQAPGTPATGPLMTCLDLTLSSPLNVESEIATFAANVGTWSGGALGLDLRVHVLSSVATSMSVWSNGLWLAPWDIQAAALPSLGKDTSFVLTSNGLRDPGGQHLAPPACGGSFGVDYGVAGSGYSNIPGTGDANPFECALHGTFEIEWMHQVHFALDNLSRFSDLYGTMFPACGQGNPNPALWFPDPDPNITLDPDSPFCGQTGSVANDPAVEHVLSTHWAPGRFFVANHCRDGVQDYGETGVDTGGNCLP
jgi:hypothetical protein